MKLIIAGSRSIDASLMHKLFDVDNLVSFFDLDWPSEFIHGGCPTGVDAYVSYQTDTYWDISPTKVFKANWDKYGKSAGPKRNAQMAKYGDALILIWDGVSKGSLSMKNEMEKLGKPVYEIIIPKHKEK